MLVGPEHNSARLVANTIANKAYVESTLKLHPMKSYACLRAIGFRRGFSTWRRCIEVLSTLQDVLERTAKQVFRANVFADA